MHVLCCLPLRLLAARVYTQSTFIGVYRERTSTSPRAHSLIQVWVPLGLAGLSHLRPQTPLGLGTGGTQSLQLTRHPGGWQYSVLSATRYPEDQSFWAPGTVRTGGTQSFWPPGTVWTGGTQFFQAPGTLWTIGTQYFLPPRYPGHWRDSVLLAPQVPWGLVGLSPFSPPGTL